MAEKLTPKQREDLERHFNDKGFNIRFENNYVIVYVDGTSYEKRFSEAKTAKLLQMMEKKR